MSYLFISHDLNTVEHMSHRVAVMYLGQIVELGTREQVFRTPLHPYSKALLAAHLVADPARRRVDRGEPRDAQRRNSEPDRPAARLLSRQPLPGCAAGMPRARRNRFFPLPTDASCAARRRSPARTQTMPLRRTP